MKALSGVGTEVWFDVILAQTFQGSDNSVLQELHFHFQQFRFSVFAHQLLELGFVNCAVNEIFEFTVVIAGSIDILKEGLQLETVWVSTEVTAQSFTTLLSRRVSDAHGWMRVTSWVIGLCDPQQRFAPMSTGVTLDCVDLSITVSRWEVLVG